MPRPLGATQTARKMEAVEVSADTLKPNDLNHFDTPIRITGSFVPGDVIRIEAKGVAIEADNSANRILSIDSANNVYVTNGAQYKGLSVRVCGNPGQIVTDEVGEGAHLKANYVFVGEQNAEMFEGGKVGARAQVHASNAAVVGFQEQYAYVDTPRLITAVPPIALSGMRPPADGEFIEYNYESSTTPDAVPGTLNVTAGHAIRDRDAGLKK